MPEPPKSPIFRFLTEKENLAAALEVTRYAEEIREYVADRFWSRLEEAIKKNPRASASFSFTRELADKSDGSFYLIARPQGLPEKAQGLLYTIEAHREHIGGGLAWNAQHFKAAGQIQRLCQLQSLKALGAELQKRLPGDIKPEPNRWWFWLEYWERNPYVADPWCWFGEHLLDDAFFNVLAEKFWDFVLPIDRLVLEANKELSRSRS